MSTRGHRWTAEQRARFRATVAAKRTSVRCDICAVEPGEPAGSFGPAKVIPFQLAHQTERDGRTTRRGVGVILLCQRCWTETAARRRRRQNVRSESAHKLLTAF